MNRSLIHFLAAIGLALINVIVMVLKFEGDFESGLDWLGAGILASLPLLLIFFPGVFAEMGRWGLMASLASDYSSGIPPQMILILGWLGLIGTTVALILA